MDRETRVIGLCQCGCGEIVPPSKRTDRARGVVEGEPGRYLRGHQRRLRAVPACGYVVDPETGCWLWQMRKGDNGYGRVTRDGRTHMAHRALWEDQFGPVPDGLTLDHLCRVRECVNPAHLEVVTPAENCRRGRNAKLTADQVAYIRRTPKRNAELAREFGVVPSNISQIRSGHSWKGVA